MKGMGICRVRFPLMAAVLLVRHPSMAYADIDPASGSIFLQVLIAGALAAPLRPPGSWLLSRLSAAWG
jgi:hypothetical protein